MTPHEVARGADTPPVEVRVRLFGAFRQWAPDARLNLAAPPGAGVTALRQLIRAALERTCPGFDGQSLLETSVLADERRLLDETWVLPADQVVELALLPPVCGG